MVDRVVARPNSPARLESAQVVLSSEAYNLVKAQVHALQINAEAWLVTDMQVVTVRFQDAGLTRVVITEVRPVVHLVSPPLPEIGRWDERRGGRSWWVCW